MDVGGTRKLRKGGSWRWYFSGWGWGGKPEGVVGATTMVARFAFATERNAFENRIFSLYFFVQCFCCCYSCFTYCLADKKIVVEKKERKAPKLINACNVFFFFFFLLLPPFNC